MEVAGVVLLLIGFLAPSCKKVLNSVAYRIRAAGEAEVIRAKRGGEPKASKALSARRRRHG